MNYKKHILLLLVIVSSCKDNTYSFPKDLETRIIGTWVIIPNDNAKIFIMYKVSEKNDSCSVFRFETSKMFYWYYINKNDPVFKVLCGNALSYDEKSNWQIDHSTRTIILDKIMTSIDEIKEEKRRYFIYEFKQDTFVLSLDKILISEYKSIETRKPNSSSSWERE